MRGRSPRNINRACFEFGRNITWSNSRATTVKPVIIIGMFDRINIIFITLGCGPKMLNRIGWV